jgi:hypothetical protein
VTEKHGISGRDDLWSHPDLLPTADDLDDPLGFADTIGAADAITAEDARRPQDAQDEPGDGPDPERES